MRLILKFGIISLALMLVLLVSFNGCVEEPTIDEPSRPFSLLRVLNVTNNVEQIRVTVGDRDPITITKGTSTDFFEVLSGGIRFVALNANGDTLFNRNVDVISFDRQLVAFTGAYNSNPDYNTFGAMSVSEGEVYIDYSPKSGSANIFFVDALADKIVSDADSLNAIAKSILEINATVMPNNGTQFDTAYASSGVGKSLPLDYGDVYSIVNTPPGSYDFNLRYLNQDDSDTLTYNKTVNSISSGIRYYLFISGSTDSLVIYRDSIANLPVEPIRY